ncbi:amino acid transporter [Lithohypha guttulata]|uniref:amino acid transporter n=1 Tax=Lithohypha guttulata TaxID=1690604 RepID=UPI002DDEE8F0|nr:amino acid transporter [Lithohypha guttulata]
MHNGVRDTPSPDEWPPEKGQHTLGDKGYHNGEGPTIQVAGHEVAAGTALHRGLKARHITMIAIGGAIGTGLIIGTGAALARAGPGSVFIAYTMVGFLVYLVMAALGEMAAWLPMSSGFTGYATRFCDPSLGFALGWTYWFKYIIVTPNQLTAAALVIQYWVDRDRINPGVWITIFLVVIIAINYFGIRFFGEFEFWLSSIKVVTIVGLIILALVIALGGADGDRRGFRYWKNPGAFNEYIMEGAAGRFLGFWSTMVTAVFAYLGTELVGVTVGEAQNPRKVVPRAIKLTFYRILFFYCLSVLFIGMCVPYNSPELTFATKQTTGASASPFVVAILEAGIQGLPSVINGAILLFVFSASNSDLYIASRTLYGLAVNGNAPRIFKRTDSRGVPIYALGMSAMFALLAYMNVADDSKTVFGYFVNLVTIFGLETWISILVTHIWWIKARRAQNLPDSALPFVAPLGINGSWGALIFCVLIAVTKNFSVFTYSRSYGNFDYKNFVTGYIGIPIYLILLFGHKILTKSKGVKAHEADFYTGKDIIDREEEEFLAAKAAKKQAQGEKKGKAGWFYKTFIGWLF